MQTQTEKLVLKPNDFNSVTIFITEPQKPLATNILGRTMSEWVMSACKGYLCVVVKNDKFDLDYFKQYLTNSKYTIILANSLILLTNDAINNLVDYVTFKGIKACKFSGGYAFETEYLKKEKNIFYDSVYYNDQQDFYMVEDKKQLKYATEVLQERILATHVMNGVEITNSYIEADVKIGKGTIIFSGNVIKGNTIIGDNVILKEKNVIENSTVSSECCVSGSTIVNSTLEEGVFVKPYCYVEKSIVRKNCLLGVGVNLVNRKTRAGSKINKKEEWLYDSCCWVRKSRQTIC